MSNVSYVCEALAGSNKVGKLQCDAAGYYEICIGGFNIENAGRAFYPMIEGVKSLFLESSELMRRVKNGQQRSEYGHPKRQPGESMQSYMARCNRIEETMICSTIKQLDLEEMKERDPRTGRAVIAVIARLKPTGPYGDALAKQLENPDENVAFSVRSFTDDRLGPDGRMWKNVRKIVTWDYVTEPGIAIATKYGTPSLESHQDLIVDPDEIREAIRAIKASPFSMESADNLLHLEETAKAFRIDPNKPSKLSRSSLPVYANW